MQTIPALDLPRYMGRWHEIARLDHRIERGMTDVTADYTLNPDGSVRVPEALRSATFYPEPEAAAYVPALVEGGQVFLHRRLGDAVGDLGAVGQKQGLEGVHGGLRGGVCGKTKVKVNFKVNSPEASA